MNKIKVLYKNEDTTVTKMYASKNLTCNKTKPTKQKYKETLTKHNDNIAGYEQLLSSKH